jgi:hypothetical protein
MMNTYKKLTHELSNKNIVVESWKPKIESTSTKRNEQCTKLKQKQQCVIAKSEKLDNNKLWNCKACSPIVHNEKPCPASLKPLNPNSQMQITIQRKVIFEILETFVARYKDQPCQNLANMDTNMHNHSMILHQLCIKTNIKNQITFEWLHTYLIIMHAHNQTFPHNRSTQVQTSHKIECNQIVQNEKIEQWPR